MAPLSTPEVARLVGIHTVTLERWLADGKVPVPRRVYVGRRVVRFWTSRDVERVKKYKAAHYRKGRGRKKRTGAK